MTGDILDIDHVMVHVHDSEAAGRRFEALGFHVTPKSDLTALGLSNRCVLFQPDNDRCANFIELMAIEKPDTVPPFMKAILGEREGPVSLVLATDDVDAAAENLRGRGVTCIDPFQVRREWRLADDDIVHPAFGVCIPEPEHHDPYWNLCQYHTRELYVRPDLTTHANGARRITGIRMRRPDAAATAAAIGKAWNTALARDAAGFVLRPGSVALRLESSEPHNEAAPVMRIEIDSADAFDDATLFGLTLTRG
ncbi:VOC family protein [Minwuia sp.]|uniref:VOC family protein n=1 Tax=Minwuia sp. TaxID=2493630 RepID=UPI003A93CDE6